ncbi:hypothetical protein [Streptomyces celluloflavus]|uniref:hypothetical protein n=1 Tax=Streptomyces celluloflavus TaxID=58344 RepID=UPI0036CE162C
MTDHDRPTCVVCHHALWHTEQHRYACRPCEQRLAEQLTDLPGLIAHLHTLLTPHTGAPGPRVTATKEPPAPLDLGVLDQITGTTAVLDTWLTDWHDRLGWSPPTYHADPLTEAARALRLNLPWAVENHPAMDDFATELRDLHHQATATLDPPERTIPAGTCPTVTEDSPCGTALRIAPGDTVIHCPKCATQWPQHTWLRLSSAQHATT